MFNISYIYYRDNIYERYSYMETRDTFKYSNVFVPHS